VKRGNFRNLGKLQEFGETSGIWGNFRNLGKLQEFGETSGIFTKLFLSANNFDTKI